MKTSLQKYNAKKKRIAKEASRLWQILIKELHPYCEVCGRPTEVGHHFVYQSQSNYLKFAVKNGIGMCVRCHYLIHPYRASDFGVIIQRGRGDDWFDNLMLDRNKRVSVNLGWLEGKLEALKKATKNTK